MSQRRLLTGTYWLDTGERMLRAATAAALGLIGTGTVGIVDIAWPAVGSIAAGAAVVSLLMSIVAGAGGDPATAGFTTRTGPRM
ncbi:holin [Nonomuraea typhae]|uniref:holin n=1 Tax=Nonomuraea typhae TaxID=2603600 RepID=UPI0012F77C24|nr:holin [Nonomuraea typhae]